MSGWRNDGGRDPHVVETVVCIGESPRAIHVKRDDGATLWVPKSVIHEDSDVTGEGDEGDLVVHQWFAESEGL